MQAAGCLRLVVAGVDPIEARNPTKAGDGLPRAMPRRGRAKRGQRQGENSAQWRGHLDQLLLSSNLCPPLEVRSCCAWVVSTDCRRRADYVGNFRAVRGLKLFHNAADVHLYGALPHLQLVGNDLVRFALANSCDDCSLPRREYAGQAG